MTEIQYILDGGDIARMMEIERASFPSPWLEEDVRRGVLSPNARCLGIFSSGRLAGWGMAFIGLWEAHLMTLAVHPDERRRGLGRKLLRAVMQASADAGAAYMELECRERNLAAQRLYESEGFTRVGRRRGYYTDTQEDAILYACQDLPEGNAENDPYLIRE